MMSVPSLKRPSVLPSAKSQKRGEERTVGIKLALPLKADMPPLQGDVALRPISDRSLRTASLPSRLRPSTIRSVEAVNSIGP
jgi:hypothetical protein